MSNFPIVGARFRPPALALIQGLPPETNLYLRAEPQNPYDENAIQVFLKSEDLQNLTEEETENLNQELASSGKDLEEILSEEEWHLGYVPKDLAQNLRLNSLVEISQEYQGKFSINFRGQPQIEIDLES